MKILFDHCILWDDVDCKLGVNWYKFSPVVGSKLPGSGGYCLSFNLIRWHISITWVRDYKAYQARINYRHGKKLEI
jgi:hypothetical protein